MKTCHVEASAVIAAPAKRVYSIIADFRDSHGHITPPKYFGPLEVEKGGYGAGTIIKFSLTVMGQTSACRSIITEPEPGRVLVETETTSGTVTTFTVEADSSESSRVKIASDIPLRGFQGFITGLMAPRVFPKIYAEELHLLESFAKRA